MEIAYIQKQNGEFINSSAYQAYEGFKLLGIQTDFFDYKQLQNGYLPIHLSKSTLICGFISSVKLAFEQLGIQESVVPDYPTELESYLGRKIYLSTMGKVKQSNKICFIKPKQNKLFNGFVSNNSTTTMIQTAMCLDDTEIYVSEPVKFVSEYRIFVNDGLMVGCKHYLGDFSIFPQFNIITSAIEDFSSAPVAYAIDFGVTEDGRTLLIEVNDAYAIGSYGLDSMLYAKLLMNRWLEITK